MVIVKHFVLLLESKHNGVPLIKKKYHHRFVES